MATKRRTPAIKRQRRSAEEARAAILDAAEQQLVEAGPGGLRLQEIAADVGISHPTVLHHFGSREALVKALVERTFATLQADVVLAVQSKPEGEDQVAALLERVFSILAQPQHARTMAWLTLSGFTPEPGNTALQGVAAAAHALRLERHAGDPKPPEWEDTQMIVMLATLTLFGEAVLGPLLWPSAGLGDDPEAPSKFRRWFARLLVRQLDGT